MAYTIDFGQYLAKENKTIIEHSLELCAAAGVLYDLGYIKDQQAYKLLVVACICHDFGKINKYFVKRIKTGGKFDTDKELAHNVLSVFVMEKLREAILHDYELELEDYYRVCFAVLNHHHYGKNIEDFSVKQEQAMEILTEFDISDDDIDLELVYHIEAVQSDSTAILVKGLLHKCDYIASSGDISKIEYANGFLDDSMDNLLKKWREKNPTSQWNELQLFCKQHQDSNIIVVAQTGMGKTEGSLHWLGNHKGFYVLPLKVAINEIYRRITEDVLSGEMVDNKVALLHSDALSYHIQQQEENKNNGQEMDIFEYYKQSRQLALPITVSTPDQLFDFVFKYPGYELKLATLSYSKIIIDEIQMYNAELLAYLIKGISTAIKYGGKVAIVTATLAPFIRAWLADEGIKFVEAEFVNEQKRHNLKIYDSKLDVELIYEKFIEHEQCADSNKTLVICNTVKKAQEVYGSLQEKGVANVRLLHSKFIKQDRDRLEQEILADGKSDVKKSVVWVTTQIVEASLDIDFDYLFTELSEINGLFQRLGRCNRKGLKAVDKYNCFVFLQTDSNLLVASINSQKGFIDKQLHTLSQEGLRGVDGVLTERAKLQIINEKLTLANINSSAYRDMYNKFNDYLNGLAIYEVEKENARFRNIITYPVIPESVYKDNKALIEECAGLIEHSKDILEKIKARNTIKQYVVNIGLYDRGKRVDRLSLGRYESIELMECEYSSEGGFKRSKSSKHFDYGDNFM